MSENDVGAKKGVFSHLFDWNRKSRKKLFANGSASSSEGKKQARWTDDALHSDSFYVNDNDADFPGGISGVRKSCEYSCASSVTDEEGFGARAPGVVARLMGLDSLPTSGVPGPPTSPPLASRFLKEGNHQENVPKFDVGDYYIDMSCGPDHYLRMPPEVKCHKVPSSPVERFGMDILPPRSKNPISVPRCKLLSPMRNPRFISPENAADIMEAAAKMYELGLRGNSSMMVRMAGSSSFPFRVHEVREGAMESPSPSRLLETPCKAPESNASEKFRGLRLNKTGNASESDTSSFGENSSDDRGRKKGKSITFTSEPKVYQKRPVPNIQKGLRIKKEEDESKLNQPIKNQSSAQKSNVQRKVSGHSTSGVLRINNQKQNCMINKGKLTNQPSSSSSNQQLINVCNESAHLMGNRGQNMMRGSFKHQASKGIVDLGKEPISSRSTNNPRKKRPMNVEVKKNTMPAYSSMGRRDKHIQSNIIIDEHLNVKQDKDDRKTNSDVVSFTFTSSVVRPMPSRHSSHGTIGKVDEDKSFINAFGDKNTANASRKKTPIVGVNVINGDSASSSLDHKLCELSPSLTPSVSSGIRNNLEATSTSGSQLPVPKHFSAKMSADTNDFSYRGDADNVGSSLDVASPSECYHLLKAISQNQGSESLQNGCTSNEGEESDQRLPSPFSVLEACFSGESCESSESSSSIIGQDQDGIDFALLKELQCGGDDHEVDYVREILSASMFQPFESVFCNSEITLDPHIYDQLEIKKSLSSTCKGMDGSLKRRLLFDCVGECLSLRRHPLLGACFRSWVNGVGGLTGDQVAMDVHKEIVLWRSMESWMVDEIVEKDFCRHLGKGVDIESDTYETGTEIQDAILTTLIDEVTAELLLLREPKYVPFLQSPLFEQKLR